MSLAVTNVNFTCVILAGGLRPSPLQRALGRPPLMLPLGPSTLLECWLERIAATGVCDDVIIVVSTETEQHQVRAVVEGLDTAATIDVVVEPSRFRGTAGLLHDVADGVARSGPLLLVEVNGVPPASLERLIERPEHDAVVATVGAGPDLEPAGVFAFGASVHEFIPSVGYLDMKEQLLPALYAAGRRVRLVRYESPTIRVRDREGYLEAVRRCGAGPWVASEARVDPTARVEGPSLVCPEARVEAEAVCQGSVILPGAVVGRGAVVARSVIAEGVTVASFERVVDRIISRLL